MDSLVFEDRPPESPARSLNLAGSLAPISLGLFLSAFVLVAIGCWVGPLAVTKGPWAGTTLLGLAAASTLISLARQLPLQNVLLVAVVIAVAGTGGEALLMSTGSDAGFSRSSQMAAPSFWLAKRCQVSLVWIVALLNCRGVIRLVLRRWKRAPGYGYWVLGATVVLSTAFVLSLGRLGPMPFESRPIATVLASTVGAFVTLLVVTPSLISKKPVPPPADWHPLVIWAAFNILFIFDALRRGSWIAA